MHKQSFAKALRKRMTSQKKILWEALRRKNLEGLKFRRQVAIGSYVVDFLCARFRLIIEIDGGIHYTQKEYDEMRQQLLELDKYKILRFSNDEVDNDLATVLNTISKQTGQSPSPRVRDAHKIQ